MTREELLARLEAWDAMEPLNFKNRDALQFALWWYGASTEAPKPAPVWPSEDYVADKTGGGPHYLTSLDAARTLVPLAWAWSIQWSASTGAQAWLYPLDNDADQQAYGEHSSTAVALCIAAIRARMGLLDHA
jgi:hypothetical protein